MTTSVQGRVARALGLDSFADITDAAVLEITALGVLFDGDLDLDAVLAVWERMESRDDADKAARAALREAAAAGATNLAQMLVAYTLGDPMPAAVLPATTTAAAKAAAVKAVKR